MWPVTRIIREMAEKFWLTWLKLENELSDILNNYVVGQDRCQTLLAVAVTITINVSILKVVRTNDGCKNQIFS